MKKRHVLAVAVLAVGIRLLIPSWVASCYSVQFVSESTPQTYQISYQKPELWTKSHLTWRLITPIPTGMSEAALLRAIEESFNKWEPAGVFTFSHSTETLTDITISFRKPPDRRWDGRLGTMGAASYPWDHGRGSIYLDPSESWDTQQFSLLGEPITAWLPHEIGHVLGLPHVLQTGYVMNEFGPYGAPDEADFSLLRLLYSPKTKVPTWAKKSVATTQRSVGVKRGSKVPQVPAPK